MKPSSETQTGRPESNSGQSFFSSQHRVRARRIDKAATWFIRLGGISIVFCVIGILVLIISEAMPLFFEPEKSLVYNSPVSFDKKNIKGLGIDDNLEVSHMIAKDGALVYLDLKNKKIIEAFSIDRPPNAQIKSASNIEANKWMVHWSNGQTDILSILSGFKFNASGNKVPLRGFKNIYTFKANSQIKETTARSTPDTHIRASLLSSGKVSINWNYQSEDLFGEIVEENQTSEVSPKKQPQIISLNPQGDQLACGTDDGHLLFWKLNEPGEAKFEQLVPVGESPIRSLCWLIGGNSLVYGDENGNIKSLFKINDATSSNGVRWVIGHEFEKRNGAITQLISSPRYKAVMSQDTTGLVSFDYFTNERHLLNLTSEGFAVSGFNLRGRGFAVVDNKSQLKVWDLKIPHPETNAQALIGKVWYENYPEPDYVWQSSSGSDDFEPKLSLIPLIFGTLKGAFYAMLFAVPLGLLAAIYTSQFASERFKNTVKPTLELLGAVPTVVIGFLAALWLAPRLEANLMSILSGFVVLPIAVFFGIFIWSFIRPFKNLHRLEQKGTWWLSLPGIALGILICAALGPYLEEVFFQGDFKLWLFETSGKPYDPRNCLGVSMALGFAVLPIIFTISDDALSSVPTALSANSFALGASRWQTVFHVVLPSATSGILAALILGLGRAIGETMIVLMATGNTPIIDLSAFNGMRTLSANIAVEIPEAPVDGTLYRVLFLSAVVLFVFTSILNTSAEWLRYRLNKKLGSEL